MAVIDIDKLLTEISPENPSGENLKHENSFMELASAAKGKAEQVMGDAIKPAEEPDWNTVQRLATDMFAQTIDLRVAAYLITALLHNKGIPGFADGMGLIEKMLQQYWETLHPQLDPEDDNDPMLRMNALDALTDPTAVIAALRSAPLVSMKAVGQFNLKDIQIASGQISPPTDPRYEAPNPVIIEGVFRDCDIKELTSLFESATQCLTTSKSIQSMLNELVGQQDAANLNELLKELNSIVNILKEQLALRGAISAEEEEGEGGQQGEKSKGSLAGAVNSRADVIRLLDKMCDYYQKNEPSSPIPLILMRAKRLVNLSFLEIMADMAADGVKQAEMVVGVDKTK